MRNNFWVTNPRTGQKNKAIWLFSNLKINQFKFHDNIVYVNNVLCYISGSKVFSKEGKPEFQIIISFNNPQRANTLYKERWHIESAFKGLKSSGFNFEDTHLTDPERVQKLLALVIIAYTLVYIIGIELNRIKPIIIKKHDRRAKSLMVYGLDYTSNVLFNNDLKRLRECLNFLSCT